jgi:hypothetical protein
MKQVRPISQATGTCSRGGSATAVLAAKPPASAADHWSIRRTEPVPIEVMVDQHPEKLRPFQATRRAMTGS